MCGSERSMLRVIRRARFWTGAAILVMWLTACSQASPLAQATTTVNLAAAGQPTSTLTNPTRTLQATKALTPTNNVPTHTPSPTASKVPTLTASPTTQNTPTSTASPTLTPTYAILRGTVLEQANCRYGPGAAYLYKYGVYEGYYMDIIGRNETGTWVVVQAIGGTNPCWVKASLIDIKGDVMSVAPTWLPLPESPYYGPLTGVWAERNANEVIISWNPLVLKAGDDSEQYPYLIEAWLCTNGQLSFNPIGTWDTMLTVHDEPGCSEASHARIYGVEKHGYTAWVTIPWPAPK
jgi:hypothetical protein